MVTRDRMRGKVSQRRWPWLLVAIVFGWSAICAFLAVNAYDPVEAADGAGEAAAQAVFIAVMAILWLAVFLPMLAVAIRALRSN